MAALTKPSVVDTKALVDNQQSINTPLNDTSYN